MQDNQESVQSDSQKTFREGDAISILSDVESQLQSLKAMHQENQAKEVDLKQRELRIEDSASELRQAQRQLKLAQTETEERAAAAAALESQLAKDRETLAQQRRLVESRAQQVNDDLEAAHQLNEELEQREKDQTQSNEQAAALERALADQSARTEEAQALAAERAEDLLRVHEQISASMSEAETIGHRLAETQSELAESGDRIATLEQQLAVNGASQSELEATNQQLAHARDQLTEATNETASVRSRIAQFERQEADQLDQISGLQQQFTDSEALRQTVSQSLAESELQLTEAHQKVDTLSAETESAKHELADSIQRSSELDLQCESLKQQITEDSGTQQELDESNEALAEAQKQLESIANKDEQIQSLESDLSRAVSGIEHLKNRYESKLSEASCETETARSNLLSAAQASKNNTDRLEKLEHLNADTQAHWQRRRERLSAMRSSLSGKRDQVAKAIVKLKERQVECERVLKQRSDVERARKELRGKRRQADQLIKRYKGAKFAMFLMAAIVLLMGISWGVASHFVQATYQASAVLSAENKERSLESYELDEWQAYHEPLLADPQFHAMAAERFRRRGISSLGSAAEVAAFISTDVSYRSNRDGEVTIEVAGKGKARSELLLNTLIASARSFSESARSQRTDGAATVISQDAESADQPLKDARPMYAGGIFGGGLLLLFGLGTPAWRRLNAASSEFDEQEKANEVGAEADWVEPELLTKP